MSEAETLRAGITIAITYLRAGGLVNAGLALRALEEVKATPRDVPREVTAPGYPVEQMG